VYNFFRFQNLGFNEYISIAEIDSIFVQSHIKKNIKDSIGGERLNSIAVLL